MLDIVVNKSIFKSLKNVYVLQFFFPTKATFSASNVSYSHIILTYTTRSVMKVQLLIKSPDVYRLPYQE